MKLITTIRKNSRVGGGGEGVQGGQTLRTMGNAKMTMGNAKVWKVLSFHLHIIRAFNFLQARLYQVQALIEAFFFSQTLNRI